MQIGVDVARAVDNKRVFVVDNDEVIRAALTFILQDENETHELPSVAHALAQGSQRRPDAIVIGVGVLAGNGLDCVTELLTRFPGVKLLIVTPDVKDAVAQSAIARGAHALLTKPFTIESARRKVDRLLGRSVAVGLPVEIR